VFPAFCEFAPSIALAQAYADAGSYQYDRYWQNYTITGGMHDWASSLGIAAIIPELISPVDPVFDQNLAAVQGVMARAEDLFPLPQDRIEQGVQVQALIWRFWKMHGGEARFGLPLAPPVQQGAVVQQAFSNAVLELHPDQADTPYLVQLAPLGRFASPDASARMSPVPGDAAYFAETGASLFGAFADAWRRDGGLRLYGYPLSNEHEGLAADGSRRPLQIFERAVFAYYQEDGSIRLEPLGWSALVRERSGGPVMPHQIR
jgi:hypothetical protein